MLDRVRLHISPLTPELLPTVLPPSALAAASEVSYHTLQTFPERNYGYVELPVAEAQKLKKRLHGSILKGSKMKIEEARPKRKGKAVEGGGDGARPDLDKKSIQAAKKRKREDGVLAGFELPEERRVKRGWTEPIATSKITKSKKAGKDKKGEKEKKRKVESSKFTDGPECLFKTKVSQNAAEIVNTVAAVEEKPKKKSSKKLASKTVVHEFSSTTKHPSFLRSDKGPKEKKPVSEYVDGKGWVDEDGNVVEEAPKSQRTQKKQTVSKALEHDLLRASQPKPKKTVEILKEGSAITSDSSSASEADSDETSSSGTSSSEDKDDSDEGSATSVSNNTKTAAPLRIPIRDSTPAGNSAVDKAPSDTSSSDQGSDKQPRGGSADPTSAPVTKEKEMHPLEALFKRPKDKSKPNLEVRTTFTFFDPDPEDAEDSDVVHPNLPQTPFTQRDYLSRRQRSAAPTPDTAAPSKIGFGPLWRGHGGDDESSESGEGEQDEGQENEREHEKAKKSSTGKAGEGSSMSAPADGKNAGQPQQSEFAKWFWEHRGETNRAWKRRKREAAKEKRHKENKEREKNVV